MTNKYEIEWLDINKLIPYAKNAKIHSYEQVLKIAGQIHAFGFDQPIVIDQQGVIIKGHGRRLASLKLGLKEVPVIRTTLDEYQSMAARIADNKVAESPYDVELLKFDLGTLKRVDFNLDLSAMSAKDIEKILNASGGLKDADGAQEYTSDEFSSFKHKCPKCDFEFD